MLKLLLSFLILTTFLVADEKVELYATKMDAKDNIVTASGEVIVIYQDYHLSAKKAVYDRNSGELELFDNVRASKGDSVKLLGNYARLNIAKKEKEFKPFYMAEDTSRVWLSGKEGCLKDKDLNIKSGSMSGCDPNNPLWRMDFSSSDYNMDTKWLNLYNARLYIYDIPVFYTPYFGYPLDTTRRTGLLPPTFGISNRDGFYYEQSLYIAEQNWWDLELTPQIRTSRGDGIYSDFRFVDTNTSKGALNIGYFKEKSQYFIDNNLANQSHYGFKFNYINSDFINQWFNTNFEGQSGIYADIINMNDVEYLNLSTNNMTKTVTAKQLLSRINLFYNTDKNYIGAYFKYYKDLIKSSNETTIQNLPAVQYHRYLDTLFENHFLYNFDIKSNDFYRQVGKSAVQTDINIPLSFQTSLFNEHINASYKPYIYAQQTTFKGQDTNQTVDSEYSNGFFARTSHSFSLSSQLTRAFDTVTHSIDVGATYTTAGSELRNGYYKERKDQCSLAQNKSLPICEFYNIADVKENLQLYYSQYFYGADGAQIIYHRLAQIISYGDVNGGAGELENEFDYQITTNLNFYNNMFYNYDESGFSKNFNKITYRSGSFDIGLSHMRQNKFVESIPNTSYLTSFLSYRYNKHYTYDFKYDYDLELDRKKGVDFGLLYKKRCWDFGLRYIENNRPTLSKYGIADSINDRYVFVTVALKPIMPSTVPGSKASGFIYKLPENSKGN